MSNQLEVTVQDLTKESNNCSCDPCGRLRKEGEDEPRSYRTTTDFGKPWTGTKVVIGNYTKMEYTTK